MPLSTFYLFDKTLSCSWKRHLHWEEKSLALKQTRHHIKYQLRLWCGIYQMIPQRRERDNKKSVLLESLSKEKEKKMEKSLKKTLLWAVIKTVLRLSSSSFFHQKCGLKWSFTSKMIWTWKCLLLQKKFLFFFWLFNVKKALRSWSTSNEYSFQLF